MVENISRQSPRLIHAHPAAVIGSGCHGLPVSACGAPRSVGGRDVSDEANADPQLWSCVKVSVRLAIYLLPLRLTNYVRLPSLRTYAQIKQGEGQRLDL